MRQRIHCFIPEWAHLWIESADVITPDQYERWFASEMGEAAYRIMLEVVEDWNLTGARGEPLPKPSRDFDVALFRTQIDVGVHRWLIWAVSQLLNGRVKVPFPKESESPSSPSAETLPTA